MRYSDLLAVVYKRLAEEWGVAALVGGMCRLWPIDPRTGRPSRIPPMRSAISSSTTSWSSSRTSTTSASPTATGSSASPSTRSSPPRTSAPTSRRRAISTTCSTSSAGWHRAERHPAHRREPVPRPRAGQPVGLPSCWIYRRHAQEGFGATMDPGARPTPISASTRWPNSQKRTGGIPGGRLASGDAGAYAPHFGAQSGLASGSFDMTRRGMILTAIRRRGRCALRRSEPRPRRDLRAGGRGPVPVRVIARRADVVTDFGDARLWSETTRFDLRVSEVADPTAGRPDRHRRRGLCRSGRAGARPRAAGLDRGCGPAWS